MNVVNNDERDELVQSFLGKNGILLTTVPFTSQINSLCFCNNFV